MSPASRIVTSRAVVAPRCGPASAVNLGNPSPPETTALKAQNTPPAIEHDAARIVPSTADAAPQQRHRHRSP